MKGDDRLRLAVAMRGGVSLAVWIGGALHEIRTLSPRSSVLGLTRFTAVDVDVLTGASAGGLNAALAGLESALGGSIDMREVWLELAGIDLLLDQRSPAPPTGQRRRSILNGDYFLEQLEVQFTAIQTGIPSKTPVEVFLAATVLGGNNVTDRSDPNFSDRRSEAYFHYRHLGNDPSFSDFTGTDAPIRLARAARATASFPVAFEPVEFQLTDVAGTLHFDGPVPDGATSVRLYDGGIVDNIPLGRAISAVTDAPSDQPVRRWMLFLHPSPDVERPATGAARTPTTVIDVLRDFLGAAGHETLLDDLAALRANNDEVAARATNLVAIAEAALDADGPPVPANPMPDADAYRLYALLDHPDDALCWRPVGAVTPPSPIAGLDPAARYELRRSLAVTLRALPTSTRPFARIVRHAHTTLQWIRWRERNGGVVAAADRRLVYDVLTIARLVDAAIDLATLDLATVTPPIPISDLVAARVDCVVEVERSVSLAEVTTALGELDGDGPLIERLASFDPARRDVLSRLAAGVLPGDVSEAAEPLSERLRAMLARVGASLPFDEHGDALSPDAPVSVFTVLRDHLLRDPGADSALAALDRIDLGDIGSHRGRATGVQQSLNYQRISGTRSSPLADPDALPLLALGFPDDSGLVGATVGDRMDPSTKLSGNALANFSAFFSRRFRANDWMWGRLDAASALADLLIRPGHLDPDLTAETAEAYVLGTGDDAPPTSVDDVMASAWSLYGAEVRAELADDGDPATLRALVTLRWQLEILDAELPVVFESPLDLGGPSTPYPSVTSTVADAAADAPADANVTAWRERLAAYARLDRSVADLWGRSKSVALGVRIVRNTTAALFPGPGAQQIARTGLGAVLLVVMSAIVNPATFLAGTNLLWLLIVVPRSTGVVAWSLLALSAVASLAYWIALVRHAHHRRRVRLAHVGPSVPVLAIAAVVMVGLHALAAVRQSNQFLRDSCYAVPGWEPMGSTVRCWQVAAEYVNPLAVGIIVFVAGVVLWSWAKPLWRITSSAAAALLMAVGTRISDAHTSNPNVVVQVVTSLWTFAAIVLIVTTLVAFLASPEQRAS